MRGTEGQKITQNQEKGAAIDRTSFSSPKNPTQEGFIEALGEGMEQPKGKGDRKGTGGNLVTTGETESCWGREKLEGDVFRVFGKKAIGVK